MKRILALLVLLALLLAAYIYNVISGEVNLWEPLSLSQALIAEAVAIALAGALAVFLMRKRNATSAAADTAPAPASPAAAPQPPAEQLAAHFDAHHARHRLWHPHTSRGVSILTALVADILLFVYMGPLHMFKPHTLEASQGFWPIVVVCFMFYVQWQEWSLMKQTGTGEEFIAGVDKIFALSPGAVFGGFVIWWCAVAVTAGGWPQLTWEHIVIGIAAASYGVNDYFTTDVTNSRLRSIYLATRPAGS